MINSHRFFHRLLFTLNCYALLSVTVLSVACFIYIPVMWAFLNSLYEFEVGGGSRYVGFDNYAEFFGLDPVMIPSMLNMTFLLLFSIMTRLTVPLLIAKAIHSMNSDRSRYISRILFLLPMLVPGIAVQMIWGGMIFQDTGLVNAILIRLGLSDWTRDWLNDPGTALFSIALIGFPFAGGFEILIYYAGLSNIPDSVTEAARLEGCHGIRKFMYIDIPLVLGQLKLVAILTIISGIQSFEGIFVLTQGGPGFKTIVPGLWLYLNAFRYQRMGYACAIGVTLFFIILGITIVNMKYFRSSEDLQATT